jgi:probable phosphoglycerate mutase
MTHIYIIRHAEAEGNLYRRVHGHYDSIVTEKGMRQIQCLERRFENIHIGAVYSSDLYRTRRTAAAIYQSHDLPLHTTPMLREVGVGVWEDVPWGQVETFEPEKLMQFNYDPFRWQVPGSESYVQVQQRMVQAIRTIAAAHDGETVAVASHGSAIRMLLAYVMDVPSEKIRMIPPCDNTGVTLLRVDGERIEIEYMNDNTHLGNDLSTLATQRWWKNKSGAEGTNFRFVPMTVPEDFDRYMRGRQDAWKLIHCTDQGFSSEYRQVACHRASRCPEAVTTVYLGDVPAGVVELAVEMRDKRNVGEIAFLYLAPQFRGQGMGVQLIGQAVSVYRGMGCHSLRLRTAETNTHAIHFYEKYGFQRTGSVPGVGGNLLVFEKDIAQEHLD